MTIVSVLPIVLLLAAQILAVLNLVLFITSHRRRNQHYSTVPIVVQILVYAAAILARNSDLGLPIWLYLTVALSDISLWQAVFYPFKRLFQLYRTQG